MKFQYCKNIEFLSYPFFILFFSYWLMFCNYFQINITSYGKIVKFWTYALKQIPSMGNYKLTWPFWTKMNVCTRRRSRFFFFYLMDFFGHMIKINIIKDWSQSIPSTYFTFNVTRRQVLVFIYKSTSWTWVFSRQWFLFLLLIQEKLCFLFYFFE